MPERAPYHKNVAFEMRCLVSNVAPVMNFVSNDSQESNGTPFVLQRYIFLSRRDSVRVDLDGSLDGLSRPRCNPLFVSAACEQ